MTVDNRSGTAWNFTINKAGRPSSIKQGTTAKGDYTYDGRQRLATRIVSNTTGYNGASHILHGYVGCPEPMNENAFEGGSPCDRVLAETDGTGPAGTKREYIWLSDMPVAVIDKSVTPNQTYMVHADHLNRPYFMTDAARAIVWKAIYEPFGAVYSTTGTAAQTYRFPGQWFQIETNLAYNWHRHYDASLGRYVSADPLGLYDGPNVYGYVWQQPTIATDPTGKFLWVPAVAVAGVAILWPEPANAPGPRDEIVPPSPLAPYVAGATAGALTNAALFCAAGREISSSSKNWRIAPGGNRTDNPYGRWPHYHRRGVDEKGNTLPGQGISRHRPWESKSTDKHFLDKF